MAYVGFIGGETTAIVSSIARGVGAASAGANIWGVLDAANEGVGKDFATGFVGGAFGYGAGEAAFWAIGKAAPYLLNYTPTFMMAFNRVTAQLGRALQSAEATWANLERKIIQGSETEIQFAEAAVSEAESSTSRLSAEAGEDRALLGLSESAANEGGVLSSVPNFANPRLAAEHYAKHVKGIDVRGVEPSITEFGIDMPEFSSLQQYVQTSRRFMSGAPRNGMLEGIRADGNIVRFSPESGYIGIMSDNGTIRTFFRPKKGIEYFWDQFNK